MTITLTFEGLEEEKDALLAINAAKYKNVLYEVHQNLRNQLKHGTLTDEQSTSYEKIKQLILDTCEEEGVSIW